MKHLFAAAAALALLSGGSAFAQAAATPTVGDPNATAALGPAPSTYPVCKTRNQDRCREPGQGSRTARAHKTTSHSSSSANS